MDTTSYAYLAREGNEKPTNESGKQEHDPPAYGAVQMQDALRAKERLDAQFMDIASHWRLRNIFEYTRVDKKAPAGLLQIIRKKMFSQDAPGVIRDVPIAEFKAIVEARSKAVLNVLNLAMISSEDKGFRGSPDSLAVEALAVGTFFDSEQDFMGEVDQLLRSRAQAAEPTPDVGEGSGDGSPTAPSLDDEEPPQISRTGSEPLPTQD